MEPTRPFPPVKGQVSSDARAAARFSGVHLGLRWLSSSGHGITRTRTSRKKGDAPALISSRARPFPHPRGTGRLGWADLTPPVFGGKSRKPFACANTKALPWDVSPRGRFCV